MIWIQVTFRQSGRRWVKNAKTRPNSRHFTARFDGAIRPSRIAAKSDHTRCRSPWKHPKPDHDRSLNPLWVNLRVRRKGTKPTSAPRQANVHRRPCIELYGQQDLELLVQNSQEGVWLVGLRNAGRVFVRFRRRAMISIPCPTLPRTRSRRHRRRSHLRLHRPR